MTKREVMTDADREKYEVMPTRDLLELSQQYNLMGSAENLRRFSLEIVAKYKAKHGEPS